MRCPARRKIAALAAVAFILPLAAMPLRAQTPTEVAPSAESQAATPSAPHQTASDRTPDQAVQTAPAAEEQKAPAQAEQKSVAEAPAAKPSASPPPPKNMETIPVVEAANLLGKKVRDAAGEDMGMVVDVLVDGYGRPRAAVIDFGGFLGVGSRKIAIDWDLLQFRPGDPKSPVILSLGRAEVQAAPEYKASAQQAQVVGPPLPEGSSAPSDAGQ